MVAAAPAPDTLPAMDAAGSKRFVPASTPVDEVRVSIHGLQGHAHMAALAAAEAASGARTLGGLDEQLRGDAVVRMSAAAAAGGGVAVEVSPGPKRGIVDVAFRGTPPPAGAHCLAAHLGLDEKLDSAVSLRWDHAAPAADRGAPVRLSLGGLFSLGRDAGILSLRMAPPAAVLAGMPAVEIGVGATNVTEWLGPQQRSTLGAGALSFGDASGKHAVRLQVAARELLPGGGASDTLMHVPLRSTKTSASYQYLCDARPAALAPGELRSACLEVSGRPGDVALARAEGVWLRSLRISGGGLLSVTAACGVAFPLVTGGVIPLEERFFLGGTCGQGPGERLPGFAAHGTGPVYTSNGVPPGAEAAGAVARAKGALRTVFRFGRDWQTERHVEEVVPEPQRNESEAAQPTSVHRLGGAARTSLAATVQWPVPVLRGLGMQAFLTGTAGALVEEVRADRFQDLAQSTRASVAAGIAAALPGGVLLGISWARPLLTRPGDDLHPLQIWLSFGRLL